MHRFFVPPECLQNGELILPAAQARQIREVLRLRAGEVIAALDNSGAEYRVELTAIGRTEVRGRVVEKGLAREPRTRLVLYQSLLKADKFEWVLQKCTELGVAEFVPVVTARVIADSVSRMKQQRWERILVEAAEQSGRGKIPVLHPACPLEEALRGVQGREELSLIPWEEEREMDLRTAQRPEGAVNLFIGPEGGFAAEEIASARAHGVIPITLGPRILRAETAGLVAATAILFARGELDARAR